MALTCHGFCEYVSKLNRCRDMRQSDGIAVMVYQICRNMYGTCIINMQRSWLCLWITKFWKKTLQPDNLRACCRHGPIFCFSWRFRDRFLFLAFSGEKGIS